MKLFYRTRKFASRRFFGASLGVLLFAFAVFAQDLPKEIRGYKVYRTKISVKNLTQKNDQVQSAENDAAEASVVIGEPKLIHVSSTGITFELPAEIEAAEQSGKIDFMTFDDFRVNDLRVSVEEYRESLEFRKGQRIALPKPIKIFVGAGQILRGALSEWSDSQSEWTVTGRIFVFGRFKKAGFKFKRVVPIEINLKIENPLPTI